jgi:hypothetical protein
METAIGKLLEDISRKLRDTAIADEKWWISHLTHITQLKLDDATMPRCHVDTTYTRSFNT